MLSVYIVRAPGSWSADQYEEFAHLIRGNAHMAPFVPSEPRTLKVYVDQAQGLDGLKILVPALSECEIIPQ